EGGLAVAVTCGTHVLRPGDLTGGRDVDAEEDPTFQLLGLVLGGVGGLDEALEHGRAGEGGAQRRRRRGRVSGLRPRCWRRWLKRPGIGALTGRRRWRGRRVRGL